MVERSVAMACGHAGLTYGLALYWYGVLPSNRSSRVTWSVLQDVAWIGGHVRLAWIKREASWRQASCCSGLGVQDNTVSRCRRNGMENARDGGIHHAWNGTVGDSCVMRHARGGKENTAVQKARQQGAAKQCDNMS